MPGIRGVGLHPLGQAAAMGGELPREYPLILNVRMAYGAGYDYASYINPIVQPGDYVACVGTTTTGDVSPLDVITTPGIHKVAVTQTNRAQIAIANLVAEAVAHGCDTVFLNYEGGAAATILGYFEADVPAVRAAGLVPICIPIASVLNTIMGNTVPGGLAERLTAVTDAYFLQAQSWQTSPPDGSFYAGVAGLVTAIRAYNATRKILFQVSTERPTTDVPAADVIAQVLTVKNLNWINGGFGCWYGAPNWANGKFQEIINAVRGTVKRFAV
jgi:hypothetical protein